MKTALQNYVLGFAFIAAVCGIISCNKYNKAAVKEQYLPDEIPSYNGGTSGSSDAEIHLGRVLFYDKALSVNNSISCASCHKQEVAFADNVAQSVGFENRLTSRNSIAIQNLSAGGIFFEQPVLFWDGRENSLFSLISKPIANHIEMGMDDDMSLLNKLNAIPYIQSLTEKAYGENQSLTMDRLSTSMSAFLSMVTTQNSKFDQEQMNNNNGTLFNALELKGKILFKTTYQCNSCHAPSPGGYHSNGFVNIGLNVNDQDKGRMNVSKDNTDLGAFKIPDLHNVALTAPYMHDGRFKTLDDVLDHYSHGIQANVNLDNRLRNADGSAKQLNITEEDKAALIAFLGTLTDYTVLNNSLLSNPFKYR